MLANLTHPTPITFSEWKYVLTTNHLLLPFFLSSFGIDDCINERTTLYLRMVVDVNPKTGRHNFETTSHLISRIARTQGKSKLLINNSNHQLFECNRNNSLQWNYLKVALHNNQEWLDHYSPLSFIDSQIWILLWYLFLKILDRSSSQLLDLWSNILLKLSHYLI